MASKPTPPGDDATVEDWHEFKDLYLDWVASATDGELVAEMVGLPVDGRPLSPSEAWRFFECEQRRKRPRRDAPRTAAKKG